HPVDQRVMLDLVNLARLSASAANLQPLKFIISCGTKKNAAIFSSLRWAGYLKDWQGPENGERPAGYIVIVGDTDVAKTFGCDHGIAAQSILLGAVEKGLGGCILGSIDAASLRESLKIPGQYEILLVIALGKPKESVVLETVGVDGKIEYWRDEHGAHHVPKRSLDEIVLDLRGGTDGSNKD
ncbi:MAG: nitroreductase family protein, partial [Candidatus Omnitrophota bacterium]